MTGFMLMPASLVLLNFLQQTPPGVKSRRKGVDHSDLHRFLGGRGRGVGCPGWGIEFIAHIHDVDLESFICESVTDKKPWRTGTNDDHLAG